MSLDKIQQYARQRYIPIMLDDTKHLLIDTLDRLQPSTILEIGMAIGYSGIIMLNTARCARLNTIEYNNQYIEIAKQNFAQYGVQDRVNIFVGDAREIVPKLTGKYDFIFMDGPKGQYDTFLPYLLDLMSVGSVLMCDNVLYHGLVESQPSSGHKHVTIARNMARFMEHLNSNSMLDTQLYPIGDGVTISTKIK